MSRVIFRLKFCGVARPESCNNIRQSVKRNYNLLRSKTVFYRENSSPVMSSLLSRAMGKSTDGHMTREAAALKEREKYLSMSVEEKRKHYKCRDDYTVLDDVQTWEDYMKENRDKLLKKKRKSAKASVNSTINKKVSIWRGDITTLEIDAIVNAANNSLLGGGGVDGAIHRGAGSSLKMECATLNGCDTGDAKISGGHKLPAKYVIHTVGPVGHQEGKLKSCYTRCLSLVKENNLKSVAFPCISTGIYGYPNLPAAHVAIGTARKFLEDPDTASQIDRIIFCLFLPIDVDIYDELLQYYFPVDDSHDKKPDETEEKQDKEEAESGTKKSESDSNTPEKLEAKANEKMEATAESKGESNSSEKSKAKDEDKMETAEKSEVKDEDKMETAEEVKGEINSDETKAEQTEEIVAEADVTKKTATSAL